MLFIDEHDIPWHVTVLTVALLCFISGAVSMAMGVVGIVTHRNASDWPTVEGRIVLASAASQPSEVSPGDAGLSYRYEVDGRQYTGRRATFDGAAIRYEPGIAVMVYYNPSSPDKSVLDPSTPGESWTSLSIGAALLIAAVVMLKIVLWKKKRDVDRILERWV